MNRTDRSLVIRPDTPEGPQIWVSYDFLSFDRTVKFIKARYRQGCTCSSCEPDANIIPWYSYCIGDVFKIAATGQIYRLTGRTDPEFNFKAVWVD